MYVYGILKQHKKETSRATVYNCFNRKDNKIYITRLYIDAYIRVIIAVNECMINVLRFSFIIWILYSQYILVYSSL